MKTVHEVSEVSGVSVRALHHYDAIGLLKPSKVTDAGYRLYDEQALARLQTVLMFRELGFKLGDIRKILDSPDFDLNAALEEHIKMLTLQRTHIDGLISAAEKMKKGEDAGFSAFDTSAMDTYAEEVRQKWGGTEAYRESEERMKGRTAAEKQSMADGLTEEFAKLGALRHLPADSAEAQAAVKALQAYITEHYYTCTNEILAGLGQMYTADARFTASIDAAGGAGTAQFVSEAIAAYRG